MAQKKRDEAFEPGDIVRLKSGGPKMTVEELNILTSKIDCHWFGGAKLQRGSFAPEQLEHVTEDEKTSK